MKKTALSIFVIMLIQASAIFAQTQQKDALVLYHNGKYKESVQVCEEELKENPNRIDSYVVMCWSLVKNKQYAEAEQRATEGLGVSAWRI